ncbi:hypothetical protein San01_05320 [Streptomyces angustmyceticus]|uniref:Uncharacterized protein n=1 Tax=Streptomyces angustmyceticus TaxID=285578 RepID=A0A5J4LD64_9ACTN|nr:hypothetical protein San01_05320 [Streptomyces angustmyceticus]
MLGTPVTPAIGVTSRYSGRVAQNRRIFPSCGHATAMFGRSADREHRPRGRRGPAGPVRRLRARAAPAGRAVSPGAGGFPGPAVPACLRARYALSLTRRDPRSPG